MNEELTREKIIKDEEVLELFKERKQKEKELEIAQRNLFEKLCEYHIAIGTWDCNNPFGKCIFEWEDEAMDSCIFCGNPEERK